MEENEYGGERLPKRRIGKTAKTAKSAGSLALSSNDAQETLANLQSTRIPRRRSQRNQAISKAKQTSLVIDETIGSASKPVKESGMLGWSSGWNWNGFITKIPL